MEKIIIANDSTLENVRLNFGHILPDSAKIKENSNKFKPLESLLGKVPQDFFPAALTSLPPAEALKTLHGNDELELFFTILLSAEGSEDVSGQNVSGDVSGNVSTLAERLIEANGNIDKDNYLNLLFLLLLYAKDSKEKIIAEIKKD